MNFAEPVWLWLAVLGPVLLFALQLYAARARRRQLTQMAAPEVIAALTRNHSPARRGAKELMLIVALAGMGLALARPQWGQREVAAQNLSEDIVFAIDCSRSMLAADVAPNRLARAKLAVQDFVRHHSHGRVGLVAFAGQAFLQCPLTFDHGAFEDALAALDENTISVPGTDVGRALDEAFRAMEKMDRQKIIVLVTDGEDLEQGGVKIAKRWRRKMWWCSPWAWARRRARKSGCGTIRARWSWYATPAGKWCAAGWTKRRCAKLRRRRGAITNRWARWARAWPRCGWPWRPRALHRAPRPRNGTAWTDFMSLLRLCWFCWWQSRCWERGDGYE
jgi:Mg-chelatase subunit ChlD